MTETSLASLGFLGICTALLEKKSFSVLRNPKLKWWHIPARRKLEIPVSLKKLRGNVATKRAFDISESGLFLQDVDSNDFKNYKVGERIELDLHFNEILKIRCQAKIVRKSPQQGIYPAGIGLQFVENDRSTKSTIRRLISEVPAPDMADAA
jgi:Tfp pilus assembly protein PilZ